MRSIIVNHIKVFLFHSFYTAILMGVMLIVAWIINKITNFEQTYTFLISLPSAIIVGAFVLILVGSVLNIISCTIQLYKSLR